MMEVRAWRGDGTVDDVNRVLDMREVQTASLELAARTRPHRLVQALPLRRGRLLRVGGQHGLNPGNVYFAPASDESIQKDVACKGDGEEAVQKRIDDEQAMNLDRPFVRIPKGRTDNQCLGSYTLSVPQSAARLTTLAMDFGDDAIE